MINVTKPFLPSYSEYAAHVEKIFARNWLTNHGPLVNDLELKLKDYLDLPHVLFLTNGTVALQIAIKALELKGEVITTPFSYVPTTSALVWEGCSPVFVDIDRETFNIDPKKIEACITEKTSGILATHVFGNPCDIDAIEKIAAKHDLKVIYDAAHSFGVKYKGKSVFDYGDISTTSFHATKIFHTIEGGAVFTKSAGLLKKMSLLRNFGHTSAVDFDGIGINGKNSELHAAMGLCNLKYIDEIMNRRKQLCAHYDNRLRELKKDTQKITANTIYNFAYYPIVLRNEEILLESVKQLNFHQIYPRRYFYPSLNTLNYVKYMEAPISEDIAKRILCLPLYHTLSTEEQDMVCRILLRTQNY
jgi:dTDP-4-amino-4,6-dideoxygalactose transaminase